jgi:hypothetical protein
MSIRVNLLKPEEARRQGVVGIKFLVFVGVGTVAAILLIVGGLAYIRYETGKNDLAAAQNIWEIREPMYNKVLKMKADLATEKSFQQELRGWQSSRIEWKPLLIEVRKICPPTVQLRRLGIRGDLFVKQAAVVIPVDTGVEDPAKAARAAAPSAGLAMRFYTITMDGKAAGAMAEDTVVQFVRTFGNDPLFKPLFEAPPKLNSLQREATQVGAQPIRTFTIEGTTQKREIREQRAGQGP